MIESSEKSKEELKISVNDKFIQSSTLRFNILNESHDNKVFIKIIILGY